MYVETGGARFVTYEEGVNRLEESCVLNEYESRTELRALVAKSMVFISVRVWPSDKLVPQQPDYLRTKASCASAYHG